MAIKLTVNISETAVLKVAGADPVALDVEPSILVDRSKVYEGDYEFTPSDTAQTIEIANERAINNITINPIPSNYGLITWNGSTLTVS